MKVFLNYQDHEDPALHKTLKITLPKSWKTGPTSRLLSQFVESYNANEDFGGKNPLKESELHLALKEHNESGGGKPPKWTTLASDAVTIEVVPDRADVYVMHGPSQTLKEIDAAREAELEARKQELASSVSCTHFGCKNRFPQGGPYPKCQYHASPPVFHETAKFWSCCPHKKAYDWDDFQNIPGCQTGICTEVKEGASAKQFLGGSDLREQAGEAAKLRSIDDFNKAQAAGGSEAAPVLERLKGVFGDLDIDAELFDQVVEGIRKELGGDDNIPLEAVAAELGKKLKAAMKAIVVEQLRIE